MWPFGQERERESNPLHQLMKRAGGRLGFPMRINLFDGLAASHRGCPFYATLTLACAKRQKCCNSPSSRRCDQSEIFNAVVVTSPIVPVRIVIRRQIILVLAKRERDLV